MALVATVRQRARSIAREHCGEPRRLASVAMKLATDGNWHLAFELFRACPACALELSSSEMGRLLDLLDDWGSTDCFGSFVSGVAWREGSLSDASIAKWARSENRWIRRAALVSTVPLNLKARGATSAKGEASRTLAVCAALIDDRDDMVVKAVSWALRELARKDPAAVRRFLKEHDSRLAARVRREVRNKLITGLKNPKGRSTPRRTPAAR